MRFEAKHSYFKKLVEKIHNFKNITFSLAKRHQALQAYLLQASAGNFLKMSLEVAPGLSNDIYKDFKINLSYSYCFLIIHVHLSCYFLQVPVLTLINMGS